MIIQTFVEKPERSLAYPVNIPWQLQRRTWKLALIERSTERLQAAPRELPGPAEWPEMSGEKDEYLRARARGRFLNDQETLVRAVTELGGGYWVLTPFRVDQGFVVLVNRGFVPPEQRDASSRAKGQIDGETSVSGLLRFSEPKGGFLHSNDPGHDRWYSRDVEAIAEARGLSNAAPYFIDAGPSALAEAPAGGLTVLQFANNHFIYALTWFGLALLAGCAAVRGWSGDAGGNGKKAEGGG